MRPYGTVRTFATPKLRKRLAYHSISYWHDRMHSVRQLSARRRVDRPTRTVRRNAGLDASFVRESRLLWMAIDDLPLLPVVNFSQ
jgi:hypothetical protein